MKNLSAGVGIISLICGTLHAQPASQPQVTVTTIGGAKLAFNSGGATDGAAAVIDGSGFVGTYLQLEIPAEVSITIDATTQGSAQLNLVINDTSVSAHQPQRLNLPAGTHFVRIEQTQTKCGASINSLRVEGPGVSVANTNTDALALLAAETYINNSRRGPASVTVPGANAGDVVHVKLSRHAFNFGVVASGTITNKYFFDNPQPGSDAWKVQRFMSRHFNAVVPGNSGKWAHNEEVRGKVTMDLADAITRFGQKHNMRVRMHTLLWDTNQQPQWATELLEKALAGDTPAKVELRKAVGERMEYYLVERGKNYFEIDGLNEVFHRPRWWQLFGAEGLAEIYTAAAEATKRGGGTAPVFINEYNVLQWSQDPLDKSAAGGSDPYANWFRRHAEALRDVGGIVGGIGIQYYARNGPGEKQGNPHSPARMMQVFQTMSVTGLPISLTEFGVQSVGNPTQYEAAQILEDTVRMSFGTPNMNTFMIWGFWEKEMWDQANRGALVDADWNLLAPGRRWIGLMAEWDTDLNVVAGPGGVVNFVGFFGDYEITTSDGTTTKFTHAKPRATNRTSVR